MSEQILAIIEVLLQAGGANIKHMQVKTPENEELQLQMLLDIIKTPYVVCLIHQCM